MKKTNINETDTIVLIMYSMISEKPVSSTFY